MSEQRPLRNTATDLKPEPNNDCTHEWNTEKMGPQPAKFRCKCGTLIYRSYEDYCDD